MLIEGPEFWRPRGIGNGGGNCFVTGEKVDLGPDVAGFVQTKEAGQGRVPWGGVGAPVLGRVRGLVRRTRRTA